MVENSYSLSPVSENIGIPSPLNFGGKESSFLSKSKQLIFPVIAGLNSVRTTSSSYLTSLSMFGVVRMRYVGLCLKPVMKHELSCLRLVQRYFT